MYLSSADDFFDTTTRELWGESIQPKLLSMAQLNKELEEGKKKYIQLYPPEEGFGIVRGLAVVAVVALSAGAATAAVGSSAAISGAAVGGAAAGGAAAAAAASSVGSVVAAGAAVGAAASAASSAITTSSALSLVQSGAKYLSKGAAIYTKVTGKETPAELMQAANLIEGSESWLDAGEKAVKYYMAQAGQKIIDEKQKELIREKLKREQRLQAERLRKMAEQKANEQAQPAFVKYLPLLVPIVGFIALG